MSLFWQLRLTILLITLISFTGSLVISLFASQGYLEQQLHRKNIDSADSLAYSISHLNKDPAIIDVQVAALFDSGQYERITVSSLEGVVISERTQEAGETGVPDWFAGLYPISVQPATAQISDTWMHYGTVSVAGNTRFAHQVLWDQAESLLLWFLIGGIGCALAGMLILLRVNRPLGAMMEQAHAIMDRNFLTISEPHVSELRSIARATNDLIRRLHNRGVEEVERMESVHRLVNYDPVTGLANREHFMNRFLQILGGGNVPAPVVTVERRSLPYVRGGEEITEVRPFEDVQETRAEQAAAAVMEETVPDTGADSGTAGEPRDRKEAARGELAGGEAAEGETAEGEAAEAEEDDSTAAAQDGQDDLAELAEDTGATADSSPASPGVPDSVKSGILFLIRVNDLKGINHTLGRTAANELLREMSTVLGKVAQEAWSGEEGDPLAARLNGSDFALVVPGASSAKGPAQQLTAEFTELSRLYGNRISDLYHIGAVRYRHADQLGELLASADAALAAAERKGPNTWHAAPADADRAPPPALNIGDWRNIFDSALAEDRFTLALHPVIDPAGSLLHQEAMVRMQAQPNGGWLDAGDFINIAARLQLVVPIDLIVIRHALAMLEKESGDLAIKLSAETISDAAAGNRIRELLRPYPERCRQLWLEVSEYGAFRNAEAMRDFCQSFGTLGCRIGIDHFGGRIADAKAVTSLGLHYLKVDASLVHGINQSRRNQRALQSLCASAHGAGMMMVASGVQTAAEQRTLVKLGFDGLAGPAVKPIPTGAAARSVNDGTS